MAITPSVLHALIGFLPARSVLSLAYPDIAMSHDEFTAITGISVGKSNPNGGVHGVKSSTPETYEAMRLLGARHFTCCDIEAWQGSENIVDLNYPHDLGKHDLVLDCGTTEHCANIWQATANAANAVDAGGHILHLVPLTMVNHGFFCPQPTFYHDLYSHNGWENIVISITDGIQTRPIDPHKRVQVAPELMLMVTALKKADRDMTYPIQYKYAAKRGH